MGTVPWLKGTHIGAQGGMVAQGGASLVTTAPKGEPKGGQWEM